MQLTLQKYNENILKEKIPTKTSELINDSNYVNKSTFDSEINKKVNTTTFNTALSMKQDKLTVGDNIEIKNNVISAKNSFVIGEIISVACSSDYVPDGCLPCDGGEYTKTQFANLWDNYLVSSTVRLNTCTYSEYASEVSTYGQCAKFAVDTTGGKFKVPLIKDGTVIQQALADGELAKCYNAGLPNIEGMLERVLTNLDDQQSGALISIRESESHRAYNSSDTTIQTNTIQLNAAYSNRIYGNSDTVQPNAVALRYFIVVANGQINESMMDWSAWASGLQSKLNTDLTNFPKPYVTEIYENGSSGYVLYSNGFCEQWGKAARSATSDTVTLLKPYKNADYNLQISPYHTTLSTDGRPPLIYETSKTADSFVFNLYTSYVGVYWKTSGYIS